MDLYLRSLYKQGEEGLMLERKNTSSYKLLNLFSFHFFQYKARISAFFTSCKMRDIFKVNNKDTRIRKIDDKVKNKDSPDIALASLLLTLSSFHFLLKIVKNSTYEKT